jgi:hypothetical protein
MKRSDIENSLKRSLNQVPLLDVKAIEDTRVEKMLEHDFITSQEKPRFSQKFRLMITKMASQQAKELNLMKRRVWAAVATVAACAIIGGGGYTYYNNPVNYVSFDLNPSIELGINAFDRVVSAEAYNDDGSLILADNKLRNMKLADALDTLVAAVDEQGYIAPDGSSVIAVTAESADEQTAAELQAQCEERLNLSLSTREIAANIYADCSNLQLRTAARELGISPGKYRLIEILRTLDSSVTVEQLRNTRISEIMARINERLGNDAIPGGEYAGQYQRIRTMSQQMQGTCDNTQQNMNQGTETGNDGQNQLTNQGAASQLQQQDQQGAENGLGEQLQTQDQTQDQDQDCMSGTSDNKQSDNGN